MIILQTDTSIVFNHEVDDIGHAVAVASDLCE